MSKIHYLGIDINEADPSYINDFSRTLLEGYYTREGETISQALARAATAYCYGDYALAQRIYDYVHNGWFMFASPVLSNALKGVWKTDESKDGSYYWHKSVFFPEEKILGMPISCFAFDVPDTAKGQVAAVQELATLSMSGGGTGAHNSIRGTSHKAPGPIPYMKVLDSAIGYFRQGKCYLPHVEVLTTEGWKRFDSLQGNEVVASITDAGSLEFVPPTEFVREEHKGKILRFYNENRGLDLPVTPDHSMVVQRKRRARDGSKDTWTGLEKVRAEDVAFHNELRFLMTTVAEGDEVGTLTPEERLRIAFQADGHNSATSPSWNCGKSGLEFHLAKKRKVDRLTSILEEGGYSYSVRETTEGTYRFYVRKVLHMDKHLDWIDLGSLTPAKARAFLEEISEWDAHKNQPGTFSYVSTVKSCVDVVQAIAAIAGVPCRTFEEDRSKEERSTLYKAYFSANPFLTLQEVRKEEFDYDGLVYCVTVPSGKILVRSNGVMTVCGNTRKGALAMYLDVDHPDIMEHIRFRVPGGDAKRRSDNRQQFHNAVNLTDEFIEAVLNDGEVNLTCPHSGRVYETVRARELWEDMIETRALTGEPYMMKIDLANRRMPETQKTLGLKVKGSNLCSEITLPTDEFRTFVCCLSSLNLEKFDEWKDTQIVQDLIRMLDNVLQFFIDNAPDGLSKAKFSAERERALGLGTFGWHSLLQSRMIPFEGGGFGSSVQLTHQVYSLIKERATESSRQLAEERGEAPDMIGTGLRNSRLMAIAPNANSADIAGTSPSIEPWYRNVFVKDTRAGSFIIKNRHLEALLESKGLNNQEVWADINAHDGSVQHLDALTDSEKAVFKTAIEMDQHWLIELADHRGQHVCQAQSLNTFFPAGASRGYVNSVHLKFLRSDNVITLYYYRTEREAKVDNAKAIERQALQDWKGEECVACHG